MRDGIEGEAQSALISALAPAPSDAQKVAFANAAQALADKQRYLFCVGQEQIPVQLQTGGKALTVTIAKLNPMFGQKDLEVFDEELRSRGFEVEHLLNPKSAELQEAAERADAVFVNVSSRP